jgi:hypothetical protein
MASCRRQTASTRRLVVVLALLALGASPALASEEIPLACVRSAFPPDARLDLVQSDLARVLVDGHAIHLQLKAPARKRLRAVTAASVGGRVTLTLDGAVLLRTWVAGEIDGGTVAVEDVPKALRDRLEALARRPATGGDAAK